MRSRKPRSGSLGSRRGGSLGLTAGLRAGGGPHAFRTGVRGPKLGRGPAREAAAPFGRALAAGDIGGMGESAPRTFDALDAVGATRCAGSLIGRVGDRGRGFTNPTPRSRLPGSVALLARLERVLRACDGCRFRAPLGCADDVRGAGFTGPDVEGVRVPAR